MRSPGMTSIPSVPSLLKLFTVIVEEAATWSSMRVKLPMRPVRRTTTGWRTKWTPGETDGYRRKSWSQNVFLLEAQGIWMEKSEKFGTTSTGRDLLASSGKSTILSFDQLAATGNGDPDGGLQLMEKNGSNIRTLGEPSPCQRKILYSLLAWNKVCQTRMCLIKSLKWVGVYDEAFELFNKCSMQFAQFWTVPIPFDKLAIYLLFSDLEILVW